MVQRALATIAQALRGIAAAVRARAKIVLAVTAAVSVFNLAAPVIILSIARRPVDFFTFNPWLRRLPEYLASEEPLAKKLSFLSNMAIAWVSADNGGGEGVEWGFIVDVPTLLRILLTSLVFGAYFALWSYRRREREACGVGFKAARPAGVAGAVTSVFGLTTGPLHAGRLRCSRPAGGRTCVHRPLQRHAHALRHAVANQHRGRSLPHGHCGHLVRLARRIDARGRAAPFLRRVDGS